MYVCNIYKMIESNDRAYNNSNIYIYFNISFKISLCKK